MGMKSVSQELVDWDFFWSRVEKHPLVLKILYFVHLRHYRKILLSTTIDNPRILELGAGTGQASIFVKQIYGGEITLIDNNILAYEMFKKMCKNASEINYLRKNIFEIEPLPMYDLVISDGLLEHFSDKKSLVSLHKSFTRSTGFILIFALSDNLFTRFLELGEKKMGFSKPIGLKQCKKLCEECGLEILRSRKSFFEYGILCIKK
jgi:SAM-dependent methyltransferase